MYHKKTHIHFIGIGGIGMSGIAKVLMQQGYPISGCDSDLNQKSVIDLQSLGCIVHQGNNSAGCHDKNIDIVVYSSAITLNNAEIVRAQYRGIPTISRALMLAELMRTKYSIAIAGSHGKTTTTSIISHLLIEAGLDPTVIIGGHLQTLSTNARMGAGDFLVAEADESDRSFLHLHATLAVITNIDLEHLETYRNLHDVISTFDCFLKNLPFYGKAFVCAEDRNITSLLPIPYVNTVLYGFNEKAEWQAKNVVLKSDTSTFYVYHNHKEYAFITFNMPGKHNVLNCLAAIAIAHELEIDRKKILKAMPLFAGVERRFSYKGIFQGAEIFDDYGHHPTEIENTLTIARARTKGKLIVVFQPHRYTRTQKLWHSFVALFAQNIIDILIITDIYPASEPLIPSITSKKLVKAIQIQNPNTHTTYIPLDPSFEMIMDYLKEHAHNGDLILFQGAGKINHAIEHLLKQPKAGADHHIALQSHH